MTSEPSVQTNGCYHKHNFTSKDVKEALLTVNESKKDGKGEFVYGYLIKSTDALHTHIDLLFTTILHHGSFPHKFATSTIVPIPKCNRKCLNASSSYKGIALSIILGKVFA